MKYRRFTGAGITFSLRRETTFFNKSNLFQVLFLLVRNLVRNRKEYGGVGKWHSFNVWSYATTRFATQHNTSFIDEPKFQLAYDAAVSAAGSDWWNVGLHFRLHQAIWCAAHAMNLPGDFVELGTGRGMTMSAVLEALPTWEESGKSLFLCDTFRPFGVDSNTGYQNSSVGINPIFAESLSKVAHTFRDRKNVRFVEGLLPTSLARVDTQVIAFLHIDLNSAEPEVRSLEFLWPRLTTGALVLLDDYAYVGSEAQYAAMNLFAEAHGVRILTLATGQGLLIRP